VTRTRRARPEDAPAISWLIGHYAAQGLLLPRTEAEIGARIGCFHVLEDGGRVRGCVALEVYTPELAEIRSLAVDPGMGRGGLGSRLVRAALDRARRQRIARVFAVTHAPDFFLRQGFTLADRIAMPEKLERDCAGCPRARDCRLAAMVATVCPERAFQRVLSAAEGAENSVRAG